VAPVPRHIRQLPLDAHPHQELGRVRQAGLELVKSQPAQGEVRFGPESVGETVEQIEWTVIVTLAIDERMFL
jgi:hypothetical protein